MRLQTRLNVTKRAEDMQRPTVLISGKRTSDVDTGHFVDISNAVLLKISGRSRLHALPVNDTLVVIRFDM